MAATEPADDLQQDRPTPSGRGARIVEALIFASPEPITPKQLLQLLVGGAEGGRAGGGRGAEGRLRAIGPACSWSKSRAAIRSSRGPSCTNGCGACSTSASSQKLTVQALETLAVIAYKQPITALEIGEIRGVNTSGVVWHAARART